ncbi:SCND3 protein, partial [Atractosteus spatula]|nr:SCND3 protein [Atractosteus spatula]
MSSSASRQDKDDKESISEVADRNSATHKNRHLGNQNCKNKVKRKYNTDYLRMRFFWTSDKEDPNPHCVLCYEIMTNEAMKPSKLKLHFESKHSQYHSVEEKLIKPAAKIMINVMLGEKAKNAIIKVPLSNDTVQCRIIAMAENVECQLISHLRQSQYFTDLALQSRNVHDKVKALRIMLELWCDCLDCQEFHSFTTLSDFLLMSICWLNFWLHVRSEYVGLSDISLNNLLPFSTTYTCDLGFFTLVGLKTKKRNRLNVEPDMRLKLPNLNPDITSLIAQQKQLHSSR